MLINSRVVLITAMSAFALTACSPKTTEKAVASTPSKATDTAAATNKDEIAATVNGTPIFKKQIDLLLKLQHDQRGTPDTPESRKMVLDTAVTQLLLAQEAVKKGLDKTPEAMDEMEISKQFVLAQTFMQDYVKNNQVTDAQVTAEYEKAKSQVSGNQFKVRHIMVKTDDEAKGIIAKLNKNPKSFETIAKEQSLDLGSKANGGELGWFDEKNMMPEFSGAIAKLKKGKFTETPVQSKSGFHVIMLEDVRTNAASFPPLEQVRAKLTQQLQTQQAVKMFDDMKAKAKIDIVAVAPAAAMAPQAPAVPANAAVEASKK